MDTSANRVAEHQRRALDFILDAPGLRQAYEKVARLPETRALQDAVAALELDDAALAEALHAGEANDI